LLKVIIKEVVSDFYMGSNLFPNEGILTKEEIGSPTRFVNRAFISSV
jgi:hypothetical protein